MNLSLFELQLAINMTHGYDETNLLETLSVPSDNGGEVTKVFLFQVEGFEVMNRCFVWQEHCSAKSICAPVIMQTAEIDTAEKALAFYRSNNRNKY